MQAPGPKCQVKQRLELDLDLDLRWRGEGDEATWTHAVSILCPLYDTFGSELWINKQLYCAKGKVIGLMPFS